MGKFLSKFKYKSSSSSAASTSSQSVPQAPALYNHSELNDIKINCKSSTDMSGFKILDSFEDFDNVLNINIATENNCLFGQNDYSLVLFDYMKQKTIKQWNGHEKDITKVLYCPKIDRYLSSSRDKTIKMWNLSSERPELNLQSHELVVTSISVDSENKHLVSGSRDNNLILWDLKTGKLLTTAQISRNLISDTFWSHDNKFLIQTGEDKEVRLWDPYNLKVIYSFPKKQYIQSSCHISKDNNYAITSSNGFQGNGCEITIWDLRQKCILKELFGHEQTVTCARIIKNDSQIVSCSNDSTVRLWDFKTHRQLESVFVANTLTSVTESKDERHILVSSLSSGIHLMSK